MPGPQRSRTVSKDEMPSSVKEETADSSSQASFETPTEHVTHVNINVSPGVQLKLTFSGVGDIKIGEVQLSLPGIGAPPYPPDSPTLRFSRSAPGPIQDPRSPEQRIRDFDREGYRVDPYTPEYLSRSYPMRRSV